jgi:hypothetical protein
LSAWYDERVAGLGERFLHEAEVAFARIDEKPLTGPPWKHRRLPDGVRRMFVLEPRVVVVALTHARQRPATGGSGWARSNAAWSLCGQAVP